MDQHIWKLEKYLIQLLECQIFMSVEYIKLKLGINNCLIMNQIMNSLDLEKLIKAFIYLPKKWDV